MIPNPGFYLWDRVVDTGWSQSPQFFRLESNDTKYTNQTLDSANFYVEPANYPTTTMRPLATPTSQFIYPLQEDMTEVYTNDTIIFEWYPPLLSTVNVIMTLVCDKLLEQASTLHGMISLDYIVPQE
jgi:hypothetical protein